MPALRKAREVLSILPPQASLQDCQGFSLYTNGSFNQSEGKLAWAVVVVGHDSNDSAVMAGFMSGQLGSEAQAHHFGNPQHTAHAAEHAALASAMVLAPQFGERPARRCSICRGMFAQGHDPLADAVGHLHGLLASLHRLPTFVHVHARTGDSGNECADSVAKEACRSHGFCTHPTDDLPALLRAPELAWLWLLAQTSDVKLPKLTEEGSTQAAIALVPEPTWTRMPGIPSAKDSPTACCNTTYNTLSMQSPAQVEALDACFHLSRGGLHWPQRLPKSRGARVTLAAATKAVSRQVPKDQNEIRAYTN